MLRFTPAQQQVVLNNRRQFNTAQQAIVALHGETMLGNAAVGNALPLSRDVWGLWDEDGIAIQRQTLRVFDDLSAASSTPMPIGKLVKYFKTISDSGAAQISLDGRPQLRVDKPVVDYHGTPLPIISEGFSFGWREVAAAASEGMTLDDDARANSQYKVAEKLEDVVINGDASIVVGGDACYGLRTHPKRNTRSTGVTLNSATGPQWIAEIVATLKLLHAKNFKVPATIYVNWDDWFYATNTEFTTGYAKTVAQRVLEMEGVSSIIPAEKIPANEIIAMVRDRRVFSVLNGMPMNTQAQFRANPTDEYNFVTMAAASLEIKFDAEDQCGIAHSS